KSGALDPRKPTDLARMRASAPVDDDAPETKSEKVPSEERGTRALRLMENGTPVWKIASLLGFTSFEVAVLTGTDLPRGPYSDLAFANVGHLIDLKRSGHSPTRTEYDIPPEDQTRRFVPASPVASYVGSPAAICSDSW
ncbi:MAG: hypothetical protein P4M15_07340, partial [Alphaproteobacteria bacterium]|nr:hypothetical protein [Alphaproteobacteria bacterium]